jgi:RND family efflux transporter MFP subunit
MARFPAVLACAASLFAISAAASEYDCMIEARQTVEIRSSVEAVIESVKVQRGGVVTKGQVLVTLESGPERAALALAEGRANNQGDIKLSQARVEITGKKLKRAEELFKQSFISANARDEAQAEYRLASEELLRSRENQQLAVLEADRAKEILDMRTIRSPVSGVVVEVMRKPGEFGAISFKDPIMRLAEINPLHVEAILPAMMYGKVKRGQRAVVVPESPIGGRHEIRVTVVDPVIDAASGTLGVRLELPNPKGRIPAGVRCRVEFR